VILAGTWKITNGYDHSDAKQIVNTSTCLMQLDRCKLQTKYFYLRNTLKKKAYIMYPFLPMKI